VRVLVTGGAGFIGSHVVDALVARDCDVRVVDDLSAGSEENLAQARASGRVELVVADVRDREAMRDAVRDIDVVMHLAMRCLRVSLYDPDVAHDVNAWGTLSLLEACRDAGLQRFLHCSSSEIYGTAEVVPMPETHAVNPTTVYGASKLAGERYAIAYWHTHDLPVVVVRPFNTFGPREQQRGPSGELIPRMVVRALSGVPPVIFGDGSQTRDFTFVSDTVRALIAACECDALVGEAVNVASGREVSVSRVAELVCARCAPGLRPVHSDPRPADVRRHCADTAKARRLLGFGADISIEDGLDRYISWFRARHPDPHRPLAGDAERNWHAPVRA
jgi:UDP-glucose 4-epimerase